uniref:Oxysterol-binding protein-related protein 1C isoform X4 n=1 Tax=Elaeis guineensis var. tenera TaxID=51953 RepID=A0A6I9QYH7_ELAGV|nr:oxysterol-binding protein-related protein 1C isoform X4 [Elaeis guineensis]
MHPFCCAPTVPVSPAAAAAATSHPFPPSMPPHPVRSNSASPHHHHNGFRWPAHAGCSGHRLATLDFDAGPQRSTSPREAGLLCGGDHREVKINDIVGSGIAGILHKWVNYGKGWRPRWFVLQDGVLSYYKIHGPDRIEVNCETEKGSKVIGEESMRRLYRSKNGQSHHPRKPFGEVHLKVSSIRESKSDDRRFSIFTGTKRLHLRAETTEDRAAWMEALQAVKEMFPRMSNSELMAPLENVSVSTEKLRQRLQEEGVSEAAIHDSEHIMRTEFAVLQNQLVVLKQKQSLLLDTLRQLETEKVDLENTLVDESQRQSKEYGSASRSRHEKSSGMMNEGSASETEDENERHDAAEEETDDEENAFFDTRDFLSSSSFKSSESEFHKSEIDSDDEELYGVGQVDGVGSLMRTMGTNYSYVRRRKKLPDPIEKEKGVSLWSMIKDNIGKDLTKVCLPVYFNEPLSSLQKCFEDLEYSYLLDRAYEWGRKGNGLMRILNVAAFAVSGYSSTEGRHCKPFNPLLGETYEAHYPDKGLRFFSEKVHGIIQDRNGKIAATLFGKWDESMHFVHGDCSGKGKGSEPLSEACILWKCGKPPKNPTRYNLTRFAITVNELTPGLKEKLPPTDSRLRPDQRCLENGEYEMANAEKLRLEQRQRQARKMQERGWKPRWFAKDRGSDTYRYIGGYWEAKEKGNWDGCPDIFGQIPGDQIID